MKTKNILPIIILVAAFLLSSCRDQIMEWEKDPTHGEVSESELPLGLAEKISRYQALNTYAEEGFILGVGMGLSQYMDNEAYRNLVNENFDEITVGYAMKHGAMVQSDGSINFTQVDALMTELEAAGLSVYGHTLCWHSNQNASYLNGVIAPTIIPGSAGSNALDLSGLQDGSFTGWNRANPSDGITVVDNAGLASDAQAVELIASASAANAWDLQLITPDILVDPTHNYEVSFYIKSDLAGQGRISFGGLNNNYPWKDWYGTGASEAFATTTTWQQVKFTIAPDEFAGNSFTMAFDLGYSPSVSYYIDVDNIQVVDLDAIVEPLNMIANGDFDTDLTGWAMWNNGSGAATLTHVTGASAYEGNGAMEVYNDADHAGNQWQTQIHSDFTAALTADEDYTISFMIRSDAAGSIRCSTSGDAHYQGDQATSTTWTLIEWTITATGGETGLNFDLGGVQGTYYIDNLLVTNGDAGGGTGPVIVEKTDAEKKAIIEAELESWISQVMTHYKDKVHVWDAINEPMLENGTPRTGNVAPEDMADDNFYWVKYIGADFGVQVINLARQYGNPGDILFVNDYNLESNLTKCDGLIAYVNDLESKGVTVDGIGTQMHISNSSDTVKIATMFTKLAATGKLIKVSELDVRLGTANPTADQLIEQAEMYRYVFEKYMELIPKNQQYGITIWGISDNADEHEYWLPDESPNLWDANYERKPAYKGVCDGLAGEDVSVGFSGELQK